jgi:hypothetical protein
MAFHDYYNLRVPKVSKDEETAEMRNLKAWKDANYRLPLDAVQLPNRPKILDLQMALYEFGTGFLFGSVFALITRGPVTIRFLRRLRRGESANYNKMTFQQKSWLYWRLARRTARIPMLFAVFQMLLRGMNPTLNGFVLPWITGVVLIGLNHMRTLPRRMRWYRYWGHYRSHGDIHSLEMRSILDGTSKDKFISFLNAWPRWFKRRLWRGMFIIFLIEVLLLPYYYEEHRFGWQYLVRNFFGFGILASPTFGPDPVERQRSAMFKRPEAPVPVVDGSNWLTHWLWKNNSSGRPYVPDQRMFHADTLLPVLEDTPDQRIKFDHTAIRTLDTTPAFLLGQKDWRNSNAPTGRHESMVRVGALADGRYVLQKICLETLVQNTLENDPRWIDPSMRDIASDLITKATEDEKILGKMLTGEILTDPWEEKPHRPLIVKDWNRREERAADQMIKDRSNAIPGNDPIWARIERFFDRLSPNPPTYTIADGPGGYENLSDEAMDQRRHYVLHVDPHATVPTPTPSPSSPPTQFWKRLKWKYLSGHDTPPGLPQELVSDTFTPYDRVYTKTML